MKKFVWRKCQKIIFVFHFGVEFLELIIVSVPLVRVFLIFQAMHHVFHILNQNYIGTFAGVDIFCTISQFLYGIVSGQNKTLLN